jgi:hypothetical protein
MLGVGADFYPERTAMAVALSPRHSWTLHGALDALDGLLAACRYVAAPVGRDPRLDLLRGFCVFAMIVDHVGGTSWLYTITGGNRGPVTAAEGFVFLSGLVLGMVSRQRLLRDGFQAVIRSTLARAWTLYQLTFALTLAFVLLTVGTDLNIWVDRALLNDIASWQGLVLDIALVRFTWHGTNILALYTLLLAISPFALFLLAEGRWRGLLGASWGLWLLYQVAPLHAALPWPVAHGEAFPVAAWQALFLSALTLGYHRAGLGDWIAEAGQQPRSRGRKLRFGLAAATIGVLVLGTLLNTGHALAIGPDTRLLAAVDPFDKASLGFGRLLYFAGTASIIYTAVTLFWRPIERSIGWLLIPLGQASLYAYAVHLFVIVAAYNIPPYVGSEQPGWELHNTIGQLVLVLLIWAMVKRKVLFSLIPR